MDAVLVDAGPLIAILDRADRHHAACVKALAAIRGPLFTVWPAVTEAAYLLSDVPGGTHALLGMVGSGAIGLLSLDGDDVARIQELMAKYGDLPMDLADASLVRVAEREDIHAVLTTDARDFRIYRPSHVRAFRVLPQQHQ